jgi:hypothetical protein
MGNRYRDAVKHVSEMVGDAFRDFGSRFLSNVYAAVR